MTIRWHKLGLNCCECKGKFTILSIFCASDGDIRVNGLCVYCGINLIYHTNIARLVSHSTKLDLENERLAKALNSLPSCDEEWLDKFHPKKTEVQ